MSVEILNPEAFIHAQVEGQYTKLLALVIWKHHRVFGVTITAADIEAFGRESASGEAVLVTHGHADSIEFRMVTQLEAARLAKADAAKGGHA